MPLQPKYRRLSLVELHELESEFVQFLASQGIAADDWQAMKSTSTEKVEGLITLFSDVVLDKVLRNIDLLEYRGRNELRMYQFDDDKVLMLGFRIDNKEIDLSQSEDGVDLTGIFKEGNGRAQFFSAERKFQTSRPHDAFKLIQEGCLISKNQPLFEALKKLGDN